jgi:hypothetical protein
MVREKIYGSAVRGSLSLGAADQSIFCHLEFPELCDTSEKVGGESLLIYGNFEGTDE